MKKTGFVFSKCSIFIYLQHFSCTAYQTEKDFKLIRITLVLNGTFYLPSLCPSLMYFLKKLISWVCFLIRSSSLGFLSNGFFSRVVMTSLRKTQTLTKNPKNFSELFIFCLYLTFKSMFWTCFSVMVLNRFIFYSIDQIFQRFPPLRYVIVLRKN